MVATSAASAWDYRGTILGRRRVDERGPQTDHAPVNYDAFKSAFLAALAESGLPTMGPPPHAETLDLRSTDREVKVYVEPIGAHDRRQGGPFHVSGTISWRWDALLTARTRTNEEDMLREILGHDRMETKTESPWIRVDVKLRAGPESVKPLPMPTPQRWAAWAKEAVTRLERVEPLVTEDMVEEDGSILAWLGDPEIKATCDASGVLRLRDVSIAGFEILNVPRRWDDPDREEDAHPHDRLVLLCKRVKAALYAWGEVTDHLR